MENTVSNNEDEQEVVENIESSDELKAETQEGQDDELKVETPKIEEVDYKEKYYYLAAEMQNMERRNTKERENLLKFGNERLLKDMLDIVDNLERTVGFIDKDEDEKIKNIVVGIEMIQKMFTDSLSKHGLKTIEAMGKEFDPNFHEALASQPSEGKSDMEIIQVHQNGYTLNDRVIRAAKVIIVKN